MGGVVIINNLYNLKKIISLILISCIFTQLIVTNVKATTYGEENIISINSIGISNNEIEYPSGSTEVFVDIYSEIVIDELPRCLRMCFKANISLATGTIPTIHPQDYINLNAFVNYNNEHLESLNQCVGIWE